MGPGRGQPAALRDPAAHGTPGQPYGPGAGGQWPAYAPPPPLPRPTYDGPVPTERPLTVRVGLGAFIGSMVLSVISLVVTMLNFDLILDDTLARLKPPPGTTAETARHTAQTGAYLGIVLALLLFGAYAMFVLFAWRGRNWARIVLWVLGGLGLLGSVISLAGPGSPVPFLTGISVFQGLLLLVAVVALALTPSNEWFRYQRWLRATGQG